MVAREMLDQSQLDPATASDSQWLQLRNETTEMLFKRDSMYARRMQLPSDIQNREKDFTNQTLRGIFGHLANG